MPFQGPHFYINDFHTGSRIELDGRVIGRVEGVVPQIDGVHVLRLIADVEVPVKRLVALPFEWIVEASPTHVTLGGVSEQHIANRRTYPSTYVPLDHQR